VASVKAGEKFKIVNSGHWGSGKSFVCHKVEAQHIPGYDVDLDLGLMVVFWGHFKRPGKSGWHAVPMDWCVSLGPAVPMDGRAIKRKPPARRSSKKEMAAFDKLAPAVREEIRQYGLDDMPSLLAMFASGKITEAQFIGRIRTEAKARGLVREMQRPVRKRRAR